MGRVKQVPRKNMALAAKFNTLAGKAPNGRNFAPNRKKKNGDPALLPKLRPGTKALREIRWYQGWGKPRTRVNKGTGKSHELATMKLIPKIVVRRVVKEIVQELQSSVTNITPSAVEALHCGGEAYLTDLFTTAVMLSAYGGRKTTLFTDVILAQYFDTTPMAGRNARNCPVSMPVPKQPSAKLNANKEIEKTFIGNDKASRKDKKKKKVKKMPAAPTVDTNQSVETEEQGNEEEDEEDTDAAVASE